MSDADKNSAPVYVVRRGDLIISAPIAIVWQHVLDFPTWQKYSIVESVSGEPGKEGEVLHLKKDEGLDMEAYYARTIRLEHESRALWKTFRPGEPYFGVVDFNVERIDDETTRFFYNVFYEFVVEYGDPAELAAFEAHINGNFDVLTQVVLPRLKTVAEASAHG
jgi:hypothetical protein